MRIHTNKLNYLDFNAALHRADLKPDVFIETINQFGSMSHDRAYEIKLAADPGKDQFGKTRTRRNTGRYGAEDGGLKPLYLAATFDEYGLWLSELYEIDPKMKVAGWYKSQHDFHKSTRGRYKPRVLREMPDLGNGPAAKDPFSLDKV